MTNVLSQALARTLSANHLREVDRDHAQCGRRRVAAAPGCVHHLVCIGQEAVIERDPPRRPDRSPFISNMRADALSLSIHDNGRGFQSDRSICLAPRTLRYSCDGGAHSQTRRHISPADHGRSGTEVTVRVSFNAMQQPINQEHHVIRWIGI